MDITNRFKIKVNFFHPCPSDSLKWLICLLFLTNYHPQLYTLCHLVMHPLCHIYAQGLAYFAKHLWNLDKIALWNLEKSRHKNNARGQKRWHLVSCRMWMPVSCMKVLCVFLYVICSSYLKLTLMGLQFRFITAMWIFPCCQGLTTAKHEFLMSWVWEQAGFYIVPWQACILSQTRSSALLLH